MFLVLRSNIKNNLLRSLSICLAVLCSVHVGECLAQEKINTNTLILANEISYNEKTDILEAKGRVEISRNKRILLADIVTYNRETDIVVATGNVSILDDNGSVMFFEKLNVTGDLKTGFAREVRVLLADKSRMAARNIKRSNANINELNQVVYSACDIYCESPPVWQVKASKVTHNESDQLMVYNNAWVELLGVPVFYTPYLAHPDPSADRHSGFLAPSVGGGSNLGFSYAQPYYWNISKERDATITPLYTSSAGKGAAVEYRQLFETGEAKVFGSLVTNDADNTKKLRGHVKAKLRWEINNKWRTGADVHLASDDTYLRRYDFDAPTWLTTNTFAERFDERSYFAVNTYHFQRQRRAVAIGSTPLIAPLIEYSFIGEPLKGGSYITANSSALALYRENGSDQTRLSTELGWHIPHISSNGHVYKLKASIRGDGYYVRDVLQTISAKKFTGFTGRAVPQVALQWQYPLVKSTDQITQQLEPIIQGVISPLGQNSLKIPNEDSRDLEFDDTNLFSEQRFTGLDRVEGGARLNYGLKWSAYGTSNQQITLMLGQTYRLKNDNTFSPQSGLKGHFSDYVGRVLFKPSEYIDISYRFRLNDSNFSPEKSEISGAIGSSLFRLSANYIFIKQNDITAIDFGEREELYTFFDTRLSKYWSLSGSHRQNLGKNGGAIRSSIGIEYEDECFIFGLDVAEDNTEDRDFQSGFSIILRFTLKTIGEVRLSSSVGVDN